MNIPALFYLIFISLLGILISLLLPLPFSNRVKLLVGPALGIVVVTETLLIISLMMGLNSNSIHLSLLIFVLMVAIGLYFKKPNISFKLYSIFNIDIVAFVRGPLANAVRKNWPLVMIILTIGTAVIYVFWTKVLYPTAWGLTTGGGGLYGDTALHSAYTSSLVYQGMPPVNPLFAGKSLVYPFLVNLFSASMVIIGSNLRFAFILPQLMYFLGFITLFYLVCKKFTNNLGTIFTLFIFFLGWGFGFTTYIQDSLKSHSWVITKEYTNNVEGYELHNVLTGLIFPERSFLPGLFIGMLITLLVLGEYNDYKNYNYYRSYRLTGILLGILPLWHTHTFIFFGVAIGLWYVTASFRTQLLGDKYSRDYDTDVLLRFGTFRLVYFFARIISAGRQIVMTKKLLPLFFIYTITFLLALPVFIWSHQQLANASFIKFTLGWEPAQKNWFYFWLTNSGLVLPLSIIGIFFLPKSLRPFFIAPWVMFIIVNLVQFQPWAWDNIKLLSWVLLFLSIPAGHMLAQIFAKNRLGNITALLLFLSLTFSGFLSVKLILRQSFGIYDAADQELAAWVINHTKPQEVFLIDPWPNHPVPGLTGRSVYLGYPGHLWVHGISYGDRESFVKQVLSGDLIPLKHSEVPINYIVTTISQKSVLVLQPTLFPVYQNSKFAVFKKLF